MTILRRNFVTQCVTFFSWLFPRRPGDCPWLGGGGEGVDCEGGRRSSRRRGRSAYGREPMLLRTSCASRRRSTPNQSIGVAVRLHFVRKPLHTAPCHFKGHHAWCSPQQMGQFIRRNTCPNCEQPDNMRELCPVSQSEIKLVPFKQHTISQGVPFIDRQCYSRQIRPTL